MGIEAAVIAGGAGLLGSAMAGRSAERAARTSLATNAGLSPVMLVPLDAV